MEVAGIAREGDDFLLDFAGAGGRSVLRAGRVVNAAGPHFARVAATLSEGLPVSAVFRQKIAFEDRDRRLPRTLPFTIDLDGQHIPWTDEERDVLAEEDAAAGLLGPMPGGVHRRPEGGDGSAWIKLGWACNTAPSDPAGPPPIDPNFPDILLRGAGRLTPALGAYVGRLPRGLRHYGGYYVMTPENWPPIGAMRTPGAFMAGALSGFGTMAATATGAASAGRVIGGSSFINAMIYNRGNALDFEAWADAGLPQLSYAPACPASGGWKASAAARTRGAARTAPCSSTAAARPTTPMTDAIAGRPALAPSATPFFKAA